MIRILFTLTLLTLFVSCQKDDNEYSDYSFFVAGHTYGKPGVDNIGFHPPFKDKFEYINNDTKIEFGVLTGDIVKDGTIENWDDIDNDLTTLNTNIYISPGNHDVGNDTIRAIYESRHGKTYFSFIQNNDLFIILDPNIDQWNISGDQLDFLKNTLKENIDSIDNIFVFFHQVLWKEKDNIFKKVKWNSHDGRAEEINFWTEIEPLFSKLNNQVVMFAGDVGAFPNGHEFMYYNYDNITFITSGMGGEERDNIVIVDIADDKSISYRLIALNGDDINALGKLEDYKLP